MTRTDEDAETLLSTIIDHTTLIAIGLLVLFTPAVLLVITMSFLLFAEGIDLTQLSVLEFAELYLLELAVVTGFGYLLYRVTLTSVQKHLPEVLSRLEPDDEEERDSPNRGAGSRPPESRESSDRR